ncbi:hypothetical protein PO124_28230 [Bacillus licheniformis]|nr:hypothetical protein [Bacillus licheniformis]
MSTRSKPRYPPGGKRRRLDVREAEIEKWKDIIERMYYPYSEELNVLFSMILSWIKSFRQRMSLNRVTVRSIRTGHGINSPLQFIKQADVLQGIYFFNHRFTMEENVATLNFMNR